MKHRKFIRYSIIEDFIESLKNDIDFKGCSDETIVEILHSSLLDTKAQEESNRNYVYVDDRGHTNIIVAIVKEDNKVISKDSITNLYTDIANLEKVCELLDISNNGILDSRLYRYALAIEDRDSLDSIVDRYISNKHYKAYSNIKKFEIEHKDLIMDSWLYYSTKVNKDNECSVQFVEVPLGKIIHAKFNFDTIEDMKEILKCAYLDTYVIGVLLQTNRHDLVERKEFNGEEYFRISEEVNSREIISDFINTYKILRDLEDC